MKKLTYLIQRLQRKGPNLKYEAYDGKLHIFTDLNVHRVIAVFPQNSMHVQEMPFLYKQDNITASHVCEWCTTHNIPFQTLNRYWSKKIIEHIKQRNMQPQC